MVKIKSKRLLLKKGINPKLRENNLKCLVQSLINDYINELQLTIPINNIVIDTRDKVVTAGSAKLEMKNNHFVINLKFQDSLIFFLEHIQTKIIGEEIIYHELCHCKDFENSCKNFDSSQFPEFYQGNYNVNRIYYELGYTLWAEYISYRWTFKKFANIENKNDKYFNKILECVDLQIEIFMKSIEIDYIVIKDLYMDMKSDIYALFYEITKKIAKLHQNNDVDAIQKYDSLLLNSNSKTIKIYELKITVENVLKKMYHTYPKWESDHDFIALGKTYFSFYNNIGLFISDFGDEIIFSDRP